MKNTKMIKVGLIISFSLNYIYSDLCELCFSDYKEINQPDSNLAEEAQKIKESKNKVRNNGDKNIEKININGAKDKSKTNSFTACEAETKKNCDTNECEIIPKDINNDNRMPANDSDIIEETSERKDDKPEIESLDYNECRSSSKDINTNIRENFSNNNASNTDENPIINSEVAKDCYTETRKEEFAATNSKVNEDFYPEQTRPEQTRPGQTRDDGKEYFNGENIYE